MERIGRPWRLLPAACALCGNPANRSLVIAVVRFNGGNGQGVQKLAGSVGIAGFGVGSAITGWLPGVDGVTGIPGVAGSEIGTNGGDGDTGGVDPVTG